jgi:hypothetical protein
MSNPAVPDQARPDADLRIGLLLSIGEQLIPLFATGIVDIPLARRMAVSAIEAYEPESRADYVNAARTIAFSMGALALLGHAAAPDTPMPEKMRAYGRANALNRSADQSERTMMQRRRYLQLSPRDEHPTQMFSTPEPSAPDPTLEDAAVQAAVAEAMAIVLARPAKSATTPVPPTAAPPTAATRVNRTEPPVASPSYDGPKLDYHPPSPVPNSSVAQAGQLRTPLYNEQLRQNSALQRAIAQGSASPPR